MVTEKKSETGKKTAIGAALGLAAAAAAGAGYYFYGTKNSAKHRAKAAKWAQKLHGDVMKQVKKAKQLDEKAFKAIVGEASKAYSAVQGIDKKDLAKAAGELKASWAHIEKEVKRATKSGAKAAKKTAAKTVTTAKKAVKKATAKK